MKCLICETKVKGSGIKYCSTVCKDKGQELKKQKAIDKAASELSGVEGKDFITCKWCLKNVKRIYGIHIKNHHKDKTIHDYHAEFPNSPVTTTSDAESTAKNSGKHMKEEKYRNLMSEKFKGSNNPNHTSKTTAEHRKSISPFSKEFKGYKDIVDKEKAVSDFAKRALANRLTETNFEYWVNKTETIEEAAKLYKERQRTFTLDKCINKRGVINGLNYWNKRHIDWSTKIESKYKNGEFTRFCAQNYSISELKFVQQLINHLPECTKYYSAVNGKQFFRYFKEFGITHSYDFVIGNKIIEFHGDYWHCNPKIYDASYINKSIKMSANEKWTIDANKKELIEKEGYQVLTIWESDYKSNPDAGIEKCLNFIYDKNVT